MSQTDHYNLPQWSEGENTDWFQLNGAFETIDNAMDENKNAAENAQVSADAAQITAENAESKATQNASQITELSTKEAQDVAALSTNIQGNLTKINQLETGLDNLSQEQTTLSTDVDKVETQLGGITFSYEGGDYYAQKQGEVKKKLGSTLIDLGIIETSQVTQNKFFFPNIFGLLLEKGIIYPDISHIIYQLVRFETPNPDYVIDIGNPQRQGNNLLLQIGISQGTAQVHFFYYE